MTLIYYFLIPHCTSFQFKRISTKRNSCLFSWGVSDFAKWLEIQNTNQLSYNLVIDRQSSPFKIRSLNIHSTPCKAFDAVKSQTTDLSVCFHVKNFLCSSRILFSSYLL